MNIQKLFISALPVLIGFALYKMIERYIPQI